MSDRETALNRAANILVGGSIISGVTFGIWQQSFSGGLFMSAIIFTVIAVLATEIEHITK